MKNDEDMVLAKLLGEIRTFPHGWRWFRDIELVRDAELSKPMLLRVRTLRRLGGKVRVYRERGSGYVVGLLAKNTVTEKQLREIAAHQLAYAEFEGLIDFDLFQTILDEGKAGCMEALEVA